MPASHTARNLPKSFYDLIEVSEKPVLVDFWAQWCGPCKMVSPIIQRIASEYSGKLLTVKINVDEKQHIAGRFEIKSIPTIALFFKGQEIMRLQGALPYEKLKREIERNWPVSA